MFFKSSNSDPGDEWTQRFTFRVALKLSSLKHLIYEKVLLLQSPRTTSSYFFLPGTLQFVKLDCWQEVTSCESSGGVPVSVATNRSAQGRQLLSKHYSGTGDTVLPRRAARNAFFKARPFVLSVHFTCVCAKPVCSQKE